MQISLYHIACPKNYVKKDTYLTTSNRVYFTSSYHMLDGANVTDLSIIINDTTPTLLSGNLIPNYAYLTEFARYYFVTTIDVIKEGLLQITLHCDVLTSFRTQLLNESDTTSLFYVERCSNSNLYNRMLPDNRMIREEDYNYSDAVSQTGTPVETDVDGFNVVLIAGKAT